MELTWIIYIGSNIGLLIYVILIIGCIIGVVVYDWWLSYPIEQNMKLYTHHVYCKKCDEIMLKERKRQG